MIRDRQCHVLIAPASSLAADSLRCRHLLSFALGMAGYLAHCLVKQARVYYSVYVPSVTEALKYKLCCSLTILHPWIQDFPRRGATQKVGM